MAKKSVKYAEERRNAALSVLAGTFRKENAELIKEMFSSRHSVARMSR